MGLCSSYEQEIVEDLDPDNGIFYKNISLPSLIPF